MRMGPIILSSLAFPALKYFSTLSYKWHDFRRKKLLNLIGVLRFSPKLLSKTFLILRYDQNVYWFLCYICQILMNLEFPQQVFEKYPNINSHDNPSSGSWVVPCRRTDTTKLIAAFRNFANAPKTPYHVSGNYTKQYYDPYGHTESPFGAWPLNPILQYYNASKTNYYEQ